MYRMSSGEAIPAGCMPMFVGAAPVGDALTDATALADAIIQQMSELCDRNSPEDEPDAMIANASEMHGCVERAIASILAKRGGAS